MRDILLQSTNVNSDALDATIREAFGEKVNGISVVEDQVTVHFNAEPTAKQIQQVEQLVAEHDPAILTPAQEAEAEREQTLQQLRQVASAGLNLSDFSGKQRDLAQKVMLLEAELRDLRRRLRIQ